MNLRISTPPGGQKETVEQILHNQLLWMLMLRVVLYTLLSLLSYFFGGASFDVILMPRELMTFYLIVVYLLTISSAIYLLLVRVHLRKFAFLQNLLDTLFATVLVYCTGGSASIFTSVYFFPIIAGGLILPRKGGLVAAAASTLLYGGILFLETGSYLPGYLADLGHQTLKDGTMGALHHFSVQGLTFFLAAILSALFSLRIQSTEQALSKSLRNYDQLATLYKQIFDNIATGIITIDNNGRITSANNATVEITGYPAEMIAGMEFSRFFPTLNLSAPRMRQSSDFLRNDGKTIRIGYSHVELRQEAGLSEAFGHQKIITLRDISEIERLERQMRQAEKLAAIGMMSASIAHDFRNPLTAISGSAQVLTNEFSKEGSENLINYELADIILRESNRMIDTISDFLKFSRPELPNREWFSLKGCLREVIQVCEAAPLWPRSATISVRFAESIDIWADRKMVYTVLNHLIQNSLAFCPPGRELIEVEAEEMKNEKTGDAVRISISDNGPGVPAENIEKIFEPFFTSRADGTGLGLAIVHQIVDEHEGEITVERSHLGGARFNIFLPLPS